MKALSVRQPWAWLIVHGYKDVENRSWLTDYRGELLIHACKTFERDALEWILSKFPTLRGAMPLKKQDYDLGGLIARVTLVDCTNRCKSPWFTGPYGWVLENPIATAFIPYKGRLGLFEIEDTLLNEPLKQLPDTKCRYNARERRVKISNSQHVNEGLTGNPPDDPAEGVDIPWLGRIIQYDRENDDWYDVDPGESDDTVRGPWPIDEDNDDDDNNGPPDGPDLPDPDDSDKPPDGFFPIPIEDTIRRRYPLPRPLPGFGG